MRRMSDDQALVALNGASYIVVEQATEMFEAFTDFETANQYRVHGPDGELFYVGEEETGFFGALVRNFMNTARPFTLHVADAYNGADALRIDRPFKLYFHRCDVAWGDGEQLGAVVRRFSLVRRHYALCDPEGETIFDIRGAFWKPWTFDVEDTDGQKIAQIKKKWSGLGREAFTDADVFGVEYLADLEPEDKLMLMSAVFLIDFLHFESSNSR